MNNLYRDLAPITEAAWAEIEMEATRTFKRHIAGRRVVDVSEPGGPVTAAISTGHLLDVAPPGDGVVAHLREQQAAGAAAGAVHGDPRPPSTTSSAARRTRTGIRSRRPPRSWRSSRTGRSSRATRRRPSRASGRAAPTPRWRCPRMPARSPTSSPRRYRSCGWRASTARTRVLLSADVYTKVSETTEHGYPIREHLNRLVDGEIIWAPAIDGAFVLSTRGGDFDLQLGTDVSIGYLSHDADTVELYLQETLTFLCYTAEASVALTPSPSQRRFALTPSSARSPRSYGSPDPAPSRTGRARRRTGRSAPRWRARDAASARRRGRWPSRCPRCRASSRSGCRGSGTPPGPRPRARRAPSRWRRSGPPRLQRHQQVGAEFVARRPRRRIRRDLQPQIAADEVQARVARQRARQQARLTQHLKTVANPQHWHALLGSRGRPRPSPGRTSRSRHSADSRRTRSRRAPPPRRPP